MRMLQEWVCKKRFSRKNGPLTRLKQIDEAAYVALAGCVDAIGDASFPRLLSSYCAELCGASSVYLSAYFLEEKPTPLYTNHHADHINDALKVYNDVAYVLDPFFQRFKAGKADEVLTLREFAPDNFKRSEYYHLFYDAMGLHDETGMQVRISDSAALFFSFGVHGSGKRTSPKQLARAFPLVSALAKRHWTVLTPERTHGTGRMAAHLEIAFNKFGESVLSPREGDIVRMILRGHSSKSIARHFGNSPETIKVHRRRVYNKLEITSQGQLLSLFLTALSLAPLYSNEDPLTFVKDSKVPVV
ncbi:MAG: hypothetical protein COA78_00150 [Blastopirellula sp.]|nr:MAG: hypothetical protein COA78_00150 [Blastopirellula sp.]